MTDDSGSVTLIFYKVGPKWWKEPVLNVIAAMAQMSSFTHVELAIGSDYGSNGEMSNVCRIFNDSVGAELTARTGRNPQCVNLKSDPVTLLPFLSLQFACKPFVC